MSVGKKVITSSVVALWLIIFLVQTKIVSVGLSDLAFFGDRRFAFFDLWTIQHFLSGVVIGFLVIRFLKLKCLDFILIAFLISVLWEVTELSMEYGLWGNAISDWKFGYELIYNRLIIDPLSVLLGALTARHFDRVIYFAIVPLFVWLIANVISPNSMYVESAIFNFFKF